MGAATMHRREEIARPAEDGVGAPESGPATDPTPAVVRAVDAVLGGGDPGALPVEPGDATDLVWCVHKALAWTEAYGRDAGYWAHAGRVLLDRVTAALGTAYPWLDVAAFRARVDAALPPEVAPAEVAPVVEEGGDAPASRSLASLASTDERLGAIAVTAHASAEVETLARAFRDGIGNHLPPVVDRALDAYDEATAALATEVNAALAPVTSSPRRRRSDPPPAPTGTEEIRVATASARSAIDGPRATLEIELHRWLEAVAHAAETSDVRETARTTGRTLSHTGGDAGRALIETARLAAAIERVEHGVATGTDAPTPRVARLEALAAEREHALVLPRDRAASRIEVTPAAAGEARTAQLHELRARLDVARGRLGAEPSGTFDAWDEASAAVDGAPALGSRPPTAFAADGLQMLDDGTWLATYTRSAWRAHTAGHDVTLTPSRRLTTADPDGYIVGGSLAPSDELVRREAAAIAAEEGVPGDARRAEVLLGVLNSHEGNFDSINTWDGQTLTLALGLSRRARLQQAFARLSDTDWHRLFGAFGIAMTRTHAGADLAIRVRSARPDAPLPVGPGGRTYRPGEEVRGQDAFEYWARDPLLLVVAREAAADPAWQEASLDEAGDTVRASLGTELHGGGRDVPLRELCADVPTSLLDTSFASLSDLYHWGSGHYLRAVEHLQEVLDATLSARVARGEPDLPLSVAEQTALARVPIQDVLDRPAGKGGEARASLYEREIPGLGRLDELGLTVRGRESDE